jgi:enoyl-CoA hydratase/carnithine racemase
MTDNVTIYDEQGVRLIVLNRPEKKNALTQAMYAAINDAIAGTDADPALHVTVITADGPVFTSGNDLAEFAAQEARTGPAVSSAHALPSKEIGVPVRHAIRLARKRAAGWLGLRTSSSPGLRRPDLRPQSLRRFNRG